MNKFMKQMTVAALVVTTMGAGTTTQAQAGSDFGKVLLGAVAVGVVAKHIKKENDRRHQAAPVYSSRSDEKQQRSSYNRSGQHHTHGNFGHSHEHHSVHGH